MQRFMITYGSASVMIGVKPNGKPEWGDIRESMITPVLFDAEDVQLAIDKLNKLGYQKVWEVEIEIPDRMHGFNPQ